MVSLSHQAAPDQLTGLIERVTFHNPDSGFCVLKVEVRGQRELVSVLGTLPEVRAGEWIDASGHWTIDPAYGQQFRATLLRTTHPDTAEGMRKYLASGLIKGIGPKFASRLIEAFGTSVFEVIEKAPDRLVEVGGIGPQRQARIVSAWKDQQAVRRIMVFLHSHGVGTTRAFRIYKTYGQDAIDKVRRDPYCLARDIWGIGFKTADQIARSLGIDHHSDLRARAGVEYVLQKLTEEGHCAFPRDELARCAAEMLDIPAPTIEAAIEHGLLERRLVAGRIDSGTPLIYLGPMDHAEQSLAQSLIALLKGEHPCPAIDLLRAIAWVEERIGMPLGQDQRQALAQALESKVAVITGGPGVGKTTLVSALVEILAAKKLAVVLCAPTGRAAKRLTEATALPATTIHRLLEFDPHGGGFNRNAANPLEGDVFIIDETSMVDLLLAHQLIRAIPPKAAVVFIGDVDQLPSVGPGSVLRDIIESQAIPVCRLAEVFRQAANSAIVRNAHRVNRGAMPVLPDGSDSDCYFIECPDPDRATDLVLSLIRQAIPRRFGLDPLNDIQVLTPMQRGRLGARVLNTALQESLNPAGPSVERYGRTYRVGDKVMQIVNNYDKQVYNGDIGRIAAIDAVERELRVRFDEREVTYDLQELDELVLAYATTIHKSQGSEYPAVVAVLHTQHYTLLQRNLLYTAMTRAKKLLVLVGTRKAMALAIGRLELSRRFTTLAQRLRQAAGLEATARAALFD